MTTPTNLTDLRVGALVEGVDADGVRHVGRLHCTTAVRLDNGQRSAVIDGGATLLRWAYASAQEVAA